VAATAEEVEAGSQAVGATPAAVARQAPGRRTFLRTKNLLRSIDTRRIEDAIKAAERQTSGEIRVSIAPLFWGNVRRQADKTFQRLGMTATKGRNGVLFFIVPSRRRFVVLGDQGIHRHVGDEFWNAIASAMSDHFRRGDFTEGIVRGIQQVGERLATHFPYEGDRDVNELPDEVDFGPQPPKRR
jgi:uncharacterized membrane protein